jgi:MFS family permease
MHVKQSVKSRTEPGAVGTDGPAPPPVGYGELLRRNPHFRRLWLADVASLFGDWFNTLAVYALVAALTDAPWALAAVFVAKLLPPVLFGPFAGLLVDRFDRRRLMIAADLVRAALVLGFLAIGPGTPVAWVYALAFAQVAVSTVFLPARSAATPNVCTPAELATANALGAVTWSTILTVGAGLGGIATDLLGTTTVFLVDSASYLVSAALIARTVIPQRTDPAPGAGAATVTGVLAGIGDGVRYLVRNPDVGVLVWAKGLWALAAGSVIYLYVLLAPGLAPDAPGTATGLLHMAAGLGTGLGPVLLRAWVPEARWTRALPLLPLIAGSVFAAVSALPWGVWLLPVLVLAHGAGGANWVASMVLLQRRSEDRFRGRVFSVELLLLNACNGLSVGTAALLLEAGATPRTCLLVFGAFQIVVALVYGLALRRAESRGAGAT